MNEWITKNDCNSKYYFKFKLHGQPSYHNAIAIGIVNEKYDISDGKNIGDDVNGWSWYILGKTSSYIYRADHIEMLPYTVSDGCEFLFEISIDENGKCACDLTVDQNDKKTIQFDEITAPVIIGASIHTKNRPLSLEIIEQTVYHE